MRKLTISAAAIACAALGGVVLAHDTPLPDGHIPQNVNYGFEVIGRDLLAGVTDGLYTDVWSHKGYAYVGTFQEPSCTRAGVFIVDIAQTLENYERNFIEGAVVAEIKSAPNTRVNDVKVHTITTGNKTRDVLVATEEKCGQVNGSGKRQLGKGGISYYDVTDPSNPHAIKQHAINDGGTHNTYQWTDDKDGKTYTIAVDDVELNDVVLVDISKPQSPKELTRVGLEDWLIEGNYREITEDGQFQTGVFAFSGLHDVWVEKINGRYQAVLSYWDAGFVVIDVDDPANPFVLGDSTYPAVDPVFGVEPGEGNGHAAVFGGDVGQYIWAGDEDFDPFRNEVRGGPDFRGFLATQGSDVPQVLPGGAVDGDADYVGLACSALDPASGPGKIAVIQRGACAFTTKVGSAEAAGYDAAVVFNHSTGCESTVSMLVEGGIPAMFVPRSAGLEIVGLGDQYDPSTCDGSGTDNGDALLAVIEGTNLADPVGLSATFDGWGYFHVLNNLMGGTTTLAPPSVPGESPDNRDVLDIEYLGHMGYFAPIEATDPDLAVGAGDLTMHNVEGDPSTAGDTPTFDAGPRSFISWYSAGMRAVEYRPGHWHTGNGGVASWNVHEVGRFIAEDGSNFWGVHVEEHDGEQIILGSDRFTGLWIFRFNCESEVLVEDTETGELVDSGLYCRRNN
ncbi:MAG: hypothetical protein HKN63_10340 [Rhodobacteraceae bacterium]|nr:hypothetical protein [Paracoccaceae bacterium]